MSFLTAKMRAMNFIILFIIPAIIQCSPDSPVSNTVSELKLEGKEEATLPDGKVVGKYNYIDKEGNPVEVKYFADDSSYGVELKSVKIMGGDANPPAPLQISKQSKYDMFPPGFPNAEPSGTGTLGPLDSNFPENENKIKIPNNFFNKKNMGKMSRKEENTVDYDLTQNYDSPDINKFGKEKLRIYTDKLHRKVREAFSTFNEELPRICDQL